ncbi:protein kinase domain-containing protein [Nannocystis bainbridge]|uniref:Protein kinase n=1 Tax=Nannocystis bainbridge TaxID=2995303 RepID=A0ABT5E2D5_9BACT|nr:protein kinase [Nannocystis bainbridge]MDC0719940.1 protein kinase [Nannocystis bainbridge]
MPLGTPGYMPPEAAEVVDARTDVFGLARTLYRLLTHLPAQSWPEGLDQVPEPLGRLVREAGDPRADLRPATMEEFRGRLHAARAHVVPTPAMRPARHLWPVPADRKPAPHSESGNTATPAGDPCTTSPASQLFERRLELRLRLRAGSTGQTWRAYHHALGGDVVVKIVPAALAEGEAGDRLRREAAALFKLQHTAFPQVYESDSAEADGSLYLVEEWIRGETFGDMMKRGRPDLLLAVELVAQVAEALALAHSRGVIHGDVHPGNFMIELEEAQPPRARVIDLNHCVLLDHFFALSAERFATPPHLRPSYRPKPGGLPAFLPPEVARGGRQTALSDLYGLGCVLFSLITGAQVPATELSAILDAGAREEYGERLAAYLADRLPDLEESELLEVLPVVLAPEPEQRALNVLGALNMSAFALALRTTAASIRETRTPADPGRPSRPQANPPASPAASAPPAAPRGPLARRLLLAAVGLVLLGGVLGAALITGSSREASAPAAETMLEPSLPPQAPSREASTPAAELMLEPPLPSPAPSREESEPAADPTLEPSLPAPALGQTPPIPPAPATSRKASRRERPQAPPEPVTIDEATEAAAVARAGIRDRCAGAPKVIAVELDIEAGRGKVSRLNFKPAAGFNADSWEECVRGELERVAYPKRATRSHVALRLQR